MKSNEFGKSALQTTKRAAERNFGHKIQSLCVQGEITLIHTICKKLAEGCTRLELENALASAKDVHIQIKPNKQHKKQQIDPNSNLKAVAKDVVIQFFRKNKITNTVESHFAIFAINGVSEDEKQESINDTDIIHYHNLFGNVDIIIIPTKATENSKIKEAERRDIEKMQRRHFISIATFLDHGQTLNVAGLGDGVIQKLSAPRKKSPKNAFKQYLDSFCTYYKEAPNGSVMKATYPEKLLLLHETKYVPLIKKSAQMKVASAGCIGSVVYTTRISETKRLGSHTIALNSRMNDGNLDPKNFVYLDVVNKDRMLTNWMERLGCGRLWLETAYCLQEENEVKSQHQHVVSKKYEWATAIPEYQDIFLKQDQLEKIEAELNHKKYSPLKYVGIFRLQDELLRAREIASGIGDKFYERKGNENYRNYLSRKNEIINAIQDREKKLASEISKKNSLYLEWDLADREKLHFRDRVLGWANRIYKDDPSLTEMKERAFINPYLKWKNEDDLADDKNKIKEKITYAVEKRLAMLEVNKAAFVNESQKDEDKRVLQEIFNTTAKTLALAELEKRIVKSENDNEIEHLEFIMGQLEGEITSAKNRINKNIHPALAGYEKINEHLPVIIYFQDKILNCLLLQQDIPHELEDAYKNAIKHLEFFILDETLRELIADRLERNRVRHCLNAAINGNIELDVNLLDDVVQKTNDESNIRNKWKRDVQEIVQEYLKANKAYNDALNECKNKSDLAIFTLEVKKRHLKLNLNESSCEIKYIADEKMKSSQPSLFLSKLEQAYGEVKHQYEAIFPLLNYMLSLRKNPISAWDINNLEVRNKLDQKFLMFFHCLDKARFDIQSEKIPSSNLLNNILFESIKDFILLYQRSDEAVSWKKEGFFDMENQYESFFSMVPSLGIKGAWNTGTKFTPSMEVIESELSMHCIDVKDEVVKAIFQKFLLERFSYYLNAACLEGNSNIPRPDTIQSFDDLAKRLPNLAGIFILGISADLNSPSPFWTEFQNRMRDIFEDSHTEREIYLPIKSGVSGTAEIGVRADVPCTLHEIERFETVKDKIPHFIAIPSQGTDIQIVKEVSSLGGLTAGRYEK